jgi:hypothetical protein
VVTPRHHSNYAAGVCVDIATTPAQWLLPMSDYWIVAAFDDR